MKRPSRRRAPIRLPLASGLVIAGLLIAGLVGCAADRGPSAVAATSTAASDRVLVWFCGEPPDQLTLAIAADGDEEVVSPVERFASGEVVAEASASDLQTVPVMLELQVPLEDGQSPVLSAEWDAGAVALFDPRRISWDELPRAPWPMLPEVLVTTYEDGEPPRDVAANIDSIGDPCRETD